MIRRVPCISWTAGQPRPHSWSRLEPQTASLGSPPLALEADIAVPPRFLQIVFTSQGNADCWITGRWETTLTDSLNPTLPGPWCGTVAATAILLGTSLVLDQEALHLAMIPVVGIVLSGALAARANELRLAVAENLSTSEAAARAVTALWQSDLGFAVPHVNEIQVGNRLAASASPGRRSPSHLIVTILWPWGEYVVERAVLHPDERALDLACGTSVVARRAALGLGPGGAFTGVHVNPAMIAAAQAVTSDVRLPIAWLTGAAHSLPFVDGSFDAGLCQFSLMFFSGRHAPLLEMRRIVAPGGRVAMAVWRSAAANPARSLFATALDQHVSAAAAATMRAPFALFDADEVRTIVEVAGFVTYEWILALARSGFFRFARWLSGRRLPPRSPARSVPWTLPHWAGSWLVSQIFSSHIHTMTASPFRVRRTPSRRGAGANFADPTPSPA